MNRRFHRRDLLRKSAAAAGMMAASQLWMPRLLAEGAPSAKLRTAVIGCANQGLASLQAAAGEQLVAMIDVDDNHLAKTLGEWFPQNMPEVKTAGIKQFYDYRKFYDAMAKEVDVVFVATPDHHHAAAALMAMQLGKHVYVEKPLAHSVDECRRLTAAAKKYKVMTQLGNQGHSGEGIRRLCEYLWAGAVGNVLETYSWAPTGRGGMGGRLPTKPVPAGLHWDEWIGPMPFREYHEKLHPLDWRSWWQFGDGSVGDWGCHNLDGPFWALKLAGVVAGPITVEAIHQYGGSDERFPLRNAIRWTYPARGNQPAVKVHWYDGYFGLTESAAHEGAEGAKQNRPPIVDELEKKYGRDLKSGGTIFVGDKGVLHSGNYSGSPRIMPEEKHRAFPRPAVTLPRVKGTHQEDFLRACKDGKPSSADFSYSGPLSEMVLLGCLGIRAGVGKRVEWDPAAMKAKNMPELDPLIKLEYRQGWGM